MTTEARNTFAANREDIERLMELHELVGGEGPGRRTGLEVLNKSGIVLTCAIWEAYVEDLASEVVQHYVHHLSDVNKLPKDLRQRVAKELEGPAVWKLAGDGWKQELRNRLKALEAKRNTALNTPKADYVERFFVEALGIGGVTSRWAWRKMANDSAKKKLDDYVTLRGDIAHRGSAAAGVKKSAVKGFRNHVERLVELTDEYVNDEVEQIVGAPLYS